MNRLSTYFFLVCFWFITQNIISQNTYTMRDTTISECKGYLTDSNKGDNGPGTYGNNEDYTFTICTSSPITLSFYGQFCLEAPSDSIRFFNGPNTSSPQIGPTYFGTSLPPAITASSGCLTVHFKSDASATYCGWTARWAAVIIPPVAPNVFVTPAPACNASQIALSFSGQVRCDSVKARYFTVTGPMTGSVTTASAIGCNNNGTSAIHLNLAQPLTKNCTYTVSATIFMTDNCDSVWKFTRTSTFYMNACPFTASVSVSGNTTICAGNCTTLTCIPQSPCLSYNYTWSHGLPPTPGPHAVCPLVTTIYTVTLTEIGGSGNSYTTTKSITVSNPSINPLPAAISNQDTICQSVKPFSLSATPPGGTWSGAGITNTLTGVFNADTSGTGTFYIRYKLNTCADSIKIVVKPLDAGFNDAGCIGGPTFIVSGGIPSGGTWSGSPYISASGSFTPSATGSHTITYTHPNGCSESKLVNINTLLVPTTVDTICKSVWFDTLQPLVSPPGGRFSGPGITDSIYGVFNPTLAGSGLKTITYKLANGCLSTFNIFVKHINVQSWMSACPYQPPYTVPAATPVGGLWSGIGITNVNTGVYNPAFKGTFDRVDTLFYTAPNGCKDTLYTWCVKTNIVKDTLFFCDNDDSLKLVDPAFNHYPEGGIFTGQGVVLQGGKYYFKPAIAGVGIHKITYAINTCSDTIKMVVYPSRLPGHDSTICSTHPPYVIAPMPPKTRWYGSGVNPATGVFSPLAAGTGTFDIYYKTPAGCSDTVQIIVYPYQAAAINGLTNVYCYKDTNIIFSVLPATGGTLTGLGVTTNTFNPKQAGAGTFYVKYKFGKGVCYTADSIKITVHPPLVTSVAVSKDTICNGESSTIAVTANGGMPGALYSYQWNNGLFPINSNVVIPVNTTLYTIKTSDGCSDPKIDTVVIVLNPSFSTTFNTSTITCYGDPGFASAIVTPPANYSYTWNTSPVQTTSTVNNVIAGKSYTIKIKNTTTGCSLDTFIKIPSYPTIKALFSPNPNLSCVPFEDKLITFLDLCNGADSGYWNFDGNIIPYVKGNSPQFEFQNAGGHNVNLTVYNKGNCMDAYSMQICILESTELFVPDIFSPNGDGQNDVFYVRGKGIQSLRFVLYDRWGEKVFESTDPDIGWDGTFKGAPAATAVYVYYLEALMLNDKKIIKKGDVTLIR